MERLVCDQTQLAVIVFAPIKVCVLLTRSSFALLHIDVSLNNELHFYNFSERAANYETFPPRTHQVLAPVSIIFFLRLKGGFKCIK